MCEQLGLHLEGALSKEKVFGEERTNPQYPTPNSSANRAACTGLQLPSSTHLAAAVGVGGRLVWGGLRDPLQPRWTRTVTAG